MTGWNIFDIGGVGDQRENNTYSLALPADTLDDLSDRSVTFTLTLQGALGDPNGASGEPTGPECRCLTHFNGAGLDFSTLTGELVPEPTALVIWSLGLVGLIAGRS